MAATYKWRPFANVPVAAQVAGEELERIRVANNGRLEQDDVVEAAREKGNPLHPAFEWNDKKAAHQHRLTQAAEIIRKLDVIYAVEDKEPRPIRAFVSVTRDEDRSYTSIVHAMSDAELRLQVLARARKELEDWRSRYEDFVEFSEVFSAIGSLTAA